MDCQAAEETIVIVAPRLPEAPGERAYSSFEIDPVEIEEAIRLDDALRVAPSVSLFRRSDSSAANATTQGISVRGIAPTGAGRALVTLDGQPLNDPFGGWVLWGALPPETIGAARVLRGPGAGPYGAGALTGVIALEERRELGVRASVEGGEDGYGRIAAVSEAGDDVFALMLAASAQRSDGFVPVRIGAGVADQAVWSEQFAAVARAEWRGDGRVFAARLGGYSDARGAGLVGAESASDAASLSLTLAAPSGPLTWRVQAWAMSSDFANSSVAVAPDRSATTPANEQYATPALGVGANAALRWTRDDWGLEVGADVRAADGETRELFAFSGGAFTRGRVAGGKTLTAGVYAETWREAGPWLFSGGVRVDQYRAWDGERVERLLATGAVTLNFAPEDSETAAPTARFAFVRDFGAMSLRGATYAGFRPPTLNELHRPFRVGNDVTEANAALTPERLTGVDLGVGGDHANWSWSAGVFATRLDDAIVNVTLGAGPGTFPPGVFVPAGGAYRQRQNAGRIEAIGAEAEARGDWSDALSWRVAGSYTDAEVVQGSLQGLRPAQSPEWSATAGLAWAIGPTTLAADVSYESARFDDDLNTRTLAATTIVDLRAEHELGRGVAVYVALDNAFDEAVETAETADGIESFGPARALRFGLRLRR